jgi:thioredoxin
MNKNYLTLVLGIALFCGLSSCNSPSEAPAANVAASNEVAAPESDPTVMEAASATTTSTEGVDNDGKVRRINTATFIEEIFDYKANPNTWVYKGNKPAIIDFYADWCGPCKRVAPIMDELALKYKGQVNFYKINTDEEKELAGGVFGIQSIPSILYIPVQGQPTMAAGLAPKEEYIKQIETTLLKK